jgi:hypothetical protein
MSNASRLYGPIIRTLSQHKWSHTAVLQGQFCHCGYNGDHENHLTLSIIRAIEASRVLPTGGQP